MKNEQDLIEIFVKKNSGKDFPTAAQLIDNLSFIPLFSLLKFLKAHTSGKN